MSRPEARTKEEGRKRELNQFLVYVISAFFPKQMNRRTDEQMNR
jgi:hypothetical protein